MTDLPAHLRPAAPGTVNFWLVRIDMEAPLPDQIDDILHTLSDPEEFPPGTFHDCDALDYAEHLVAYFAQPLGTPAPFVKMPRLSDFVRRD